MINPLQTWRKKSRFTAGGRCAGSFSNSITSANSRVRKGFRYEAGDLVQFYIFIKKHRWKNLWHSRYNSLNSANNLYSFYDWKFNTGLFCRLQLTIQMCTQWSLAGDCILSSLGSRCITVYPTVNPFLSSFHICSTKHDKKHFARGHHGFFCHNQTFFFLNVLFLQPDRFFQLNRVDALKINLVKQNTNVAICTVCTSNRVHLQKEYIKLRVL